MGRVIFYGLVLWTGIGISVLKGYEDNSAVYIKDNSGKFCPYLNPVWLWKNYKLNIIGTLLLTILFNIVCPIISILYWVGWICTVGRK